VTTAIPRQGRVAQPLRWVAAGAFVLLFALATKTNADPDLWGFLRVGLDMVHTRALPALDPYSFTQDRPWINHEWLSQVALGLAYTAGGVAGLALLKGILTVSILLPVWWALRGADPVARMITLAIVVIGTAPSTATLRPQLWSMLCLVVLCRALASNRRSAKRWLPLLFAAWANLHGGWIVGLGVLGLWAAADVLSERRGVIEWAAIVCASVAATLATPYGAALWRFIADTVQFTRNLGDWQPLWTARTMNWLPCAVAFVAAIWATLQPHRHRWHIAGVLALLAYSSLRVWRIGPLFVVATAVLIGPLIAARWPGRAARVQPPSAANDRAAAAVLCLAMIAGAAWVASTSLRCIEVTGTWVPPADAVRLLASARPGRIVTFFDWGEYVLWHLGPRLRVSMDGRRETVYSDAPLAEHDAILAGVPAGFRTLDAWRPEYVWLPARSKATKGWLAGHGYRIELDSPESFVAVRGDLPALERAPVMASSPRCFPD
jgi:hypothetical protein